MGNDGGTADPDGDGRKNFEEYLADESHNHNDVGHFILFLDGQPGIIDLGRETYSRKTFSAQRYELFTGDRSEKNLHLYHKLGYRVIRSQPLTPRVTLAYLEKRP